MGDKSEPSQGKTTQVQGQHAMTNLTPQRASPPGLENGIPADQIYRPEDVNRDDPNIHIIDLPPQKKPSFKEQILGYASVIRGTAFAKPDVKEHGERVLRGEEAIHRRRGSAAE